MPRYALLLRRLRFRATLYAAVFMLRLRHAASCRAAFSLLRRRCHVMPKMMFSPLPADMLDVYARCFRLIATPICRYAAIFRLLTPRRYCRLIIEYHEIE